MRRPPSAQLAFRYGKVSAAASRIKMLRYYSTSVYGNGKIGVGMPSRQRLTSYTAASITRWYYRSICHGAENRRYAF